MGGPRAGRHSLGHGFRRGSRKKGLQTTLQDEITQEIETLLGRSAIADLDLEAVEMAARRQALHLAAHALEQRLNADTSDHAGAEIACPCGGSAQYAGRHEKTFTSVLVRTLTTAACLLSLPAVPSRILSAGSSFTIARVLPNTRGTAHDGQHSRAGEFSREPRTAAGAGRDRSQYQAGGTRRRSPGSRDCRG